MQNTTSNEPNQIFTKRDIHQQVADSIISQLEAGTVPWHRPWKGDGNLMLNLPKNASTNKTYRGINIILLWSSTLANNFTSAEWGSFRQWQDKKQAIRKGEKGTMIVYYDTFEKEVDGEIKKIPFLKSSVVFNRCQLKDYEPEPAEKPADEIGDFVLRMQNVEHFVGYTDATIIHQGSEACYASKEDCIYMPEIEDFVATENCTATEGYYATLMHELTHWSGAEKRLNRVKGKRFGDQQYANEELVAEFGAAFLCAGFGLPTAEKGNHAAYIKSWLKVLKDDKHVIFAAASEASKAVDYLHGFQPAL